MTAKPPDDGPLHPSSTEGEEPRWLDDSRNVRRLIHVFWGLCALLFLIDLPGLFGWDLYAQGGHYPWERFPGFHAVFGFVACVTLVELAKLLRKVVMRPESYYEEL